jgi:hypothetical protein
MALLNRRRARSLLIQILPRTLTEGKTVELIRRPGGRMFRFPGILVRYRLCLETRDGRRVERVADPDLPDRPLPVPRRGAYYSPADELMVFDALGIASFSWFLPQGPDARVLAGPRPAEDPAPARPRAGGREQRTGPHYRRSEDLVDHRPYIPGDDPRRINWKLYSHGPSASLFVREGETEPPPRSRLLILVDTEADPALYDPGRGREGVDLLCAQALAIALDLSGRGMDVMVGYTGGKLWSGDGAELSQALAWPAALSLSVPAPPAGPRGRLRAALSGGGAAGRAGAGLADTAGGRADAAEAPAGPGVGPGPAGSGPGRAKRRDRDLPPPELPLATDRGTCVLALPRSLAGPDSGALERFLARRGPAGPEAGAPSCELFFLYQVDDPPSLREAAETCARLYGGRSGLRAQALGLESPAVDEGAAP